MVINKEMIKNAQKRADRSGNEHFNRAWGNDIDFADLGGGRDIGDTEDGAG